MLAAELTTALGAPDQAHLFWAREMQALSFAVHIPLVCFGVAFPVMVLVAEWRGRRARDPHLLALARRWSTVMVTLFAVGVVTGAHLAAVFMAGDAHRRGLADLEGWLYRLTLRGDLDKPYEAVDLR